MIGDFNNPGFDWNHDLSVPECHYYTFSTPSVCLTCITALMLMAAVICVI
jgi:hypothetical protein